MLCCVPALLLLLLVLLYRCDHTAVVIVVSVCVRTSAAISYLHKTVKTDTILLDNYCTTMAMPASYLR
jgi:hypothetical protein